MEPAGIEPATSCLQRKDRPLRAGCDKSRNPCTSVVSRSADAIPDDSESHPGLPIGCPSSVPECRQARLAHAMPGFVSSFASSSGSFTTSNRGRGTLLAKRIRSPSWWRSTCAAQARRSSALRPRSSRRATSHSRAWSSRGNCTYTTIVGAELVGVRISRPRPRLCSFDSSVVAVPASGETRIRAHHERRGRVRDTRHDCRVCAERRDLRLDMRLCGSTGRPGRGRLQGGMHPRRDRHRRCAVRAHARETHHHGPGCRQAVIGFHSRSPHS